VAALLFLDPFAASGRDPGPLISLPLFSEAAALLVARVGLGLGLRSRRRTRSGAQQQILRLGFRGVALNALVIGLVIVPNVVALLLPRSEMTIAPV
jgi:hypothetical protein